MAAAVTVLHEALLLTRILPELQHVSLFLPPWPWLVVQAPTHHRRAPRDGPLTHHHHIHAANIHHCENTAAASSRVLCLGSSRSAAAVCWWSIAAARTAFPSPPPPRRVCDIPGALGGLLAGPPSAAPQTFSSAAGVMPRRCQQRRARLLNPLSLVSAPRVLHDNKCYGRERV